MFEPKDVTLKPECARLLREHIASPQPPQLPPSVLPQPPNLFVDAAVLPAALPAAGGDGLEPLEGFVSCSDQY